MLPRMQPRARLAFSASRLGSSPLSSALSGSLSDSPVRFAQDDAIAIGDSAGTWCWKQWLPELSPAPRSLLGLRGDTKDHAPRRQRHGPVNCEWTQAAKPCVKLRWHQDPVHQCVMRGAAPR